MIRVGLKPLFIGKSKIKNEYEMYISDYGVYSTRPKTKDGRKMEQITVNDRG